MPVKGGLPVGIHAAEAFADLLQKPGVEQRQDVFGRGQVEFTDLKCLLIRTGVNFDDIFAVPGVQTNSKLGVGNILDKTHASK